MNEEDPTGAALDPTAFTLETSDGAPGLRTMLLAGEVDLATSDRFRQEIDRALNDGVETLIADVVGVTFIDSTMLKEILRAHRDLEEAGGRLVLAGAQPAVRRLLELTGTTGFFNLVDSPGEAL